MSMSKKDFIALAEYIRYANHEDTATFSPEQLGILADFCKQQNPRFLRDRWLGYIAGENGKNGGKVNHTNTHDFGDATHAAHTNGEHCIYCDATKKQAAKTVCPEYHEEAQ